MKIAIIGGGMAGLGVAYELSKKGHSVSIFEKGKRLGGLAVSSFIDGVPIESFYHHMFPTYYDFFEIAEEIGIKDKIFFTKAKTGVFYDGKVYPFSSPIDLLLFKPVSFFDRLKTGFWTLYLKKKRSWNTFENVTAKSWLKEKFGERVYDVMWRPLLESKFGKYTDEIGMTWFWSRIYERPSKFGYFEGGFNILVESLSSFLIKNGVVLNLNAEVLSLTKNDKDFSIKLLNGSEEKFDQVVVAAPPIPFSKVAHNLLPRDYVFNLENFRYVGTICAILVLKEHLTNYYWLNINDENSPFVAVVEQTNFVPEDTYKGKHPIYLSRYIDSSDPFYQLSEQEIWNRFLGSLKKIIPSFNESMIEEKYLFKAPFTQPVIKTNYKYIKPSFNTPCDGLWWVSMSHIYPWDRGTDHSFHEGRELARQLIKQNDK